MPNKLVFGSLALLLGALVIPACGSSTSSGPFIDDITVTDPVPQNDDGTYDVDMNITFDDDVEVDTYILHCTDGVDASNDVDIDDGIIDPAVSSGDFELDINLPDTTVSGTYSCEVTLEDIDGFLSDTYAITVDLE